MSAGPANSATRHGARAAVAAGEAGGARGATAALVGAFGAPAATLGAAVIGIAFAGGVLRGAPTPQPAPVSIVVLMVAAAQVAWAVTSLRGGRLLARRPALAVTGVALAGWLAMALVSPSGPHGGRIAAALAAVLCASTLLAAGIARGGEDVDPAADASPWLQLGVLLVMSVLVAAAVTAGLAGSPAGDGAMNHMAGM